ncbi:MAG TPA: RidA family protein [Thermoanaerobaculia bacterium]|nr:RidA family protein [Thermoanaerobaculia bacterium]
MTRRSLIVLAVMLGFCAGAAAQTRMRHVQPSGLENNPRYTHAVVVEPGRMVYVSGQVARDASGKTVGAGDMRAQAKQVFENLKIALEAAGSDFAHVVKLNSYLTDMGQMAAYRDVRTEYMGSLAHPPASTTIGVSRLVDPDLLLEVEAIAVVAEPPKGKTAPRK